MCSMRSYIGPIVIVPGRTLCYGGGGGTGGHGIGVDDVDIINMG